MNLQLPHSLLFSMDACLFRVWCSLPCSVCRLLVRSHLPLTHHELEVVVPHAFSQYGPVAHLGIWQQPPI